MAIVGLSKPYVAKYKHDGNGKVTYSDVKQAEKAVEYSIEFDSGDVNNFYADNAIAETASGKITGGTLTITTDDLTADISKMILGLKEVDRTIEGLQDGSPLKELVYDDDLASPDLGFGIIEKHIHAGKTLYRPVVLAKVRFNIPNDAATTQEDEIDWQTKELEAAILQSDQCDEHYHHPIKMEPGKMFELESDAEKYIKAVLTTASEAA